MICVSSRSVGESMQRYAGLGSERYCWREGSVIDDLRYVHGFGIERNSSVRGVQIQSILRRFLTFICGMSCDRDAGGGPASAGLPPKAFSLSTSIVYI